MHSAWSFLHHLADVVNECIWLGVGAGVVGTGSTALIGCSSALSAEVQEALALLGLQFDELIRDILQAAVNIVKVL